MTDQTTRLRTRTERVHAIMVAARRLADVQQSHAAEVVRRDAMDIESSDLALAASADRWVAAEKEVRAVAERNVLPDVDTLAQIIRTVDGNHDLGAGALAEAIIDALAGA